MAIIGFSGSGKSVAIKHIVGPARARTRARVRGRPGGAERCRARSSTRCARTSATSSSSPRSSTRSPSARTSRWGCASRGRSSEPEIKQRVAEALELVDLPGARRTLPRRAVGRHAQARGHRARDRAPPEVHPVRRAHHGPRSGDERRHRRADDPACRSSSKVTGVVITHDMRSAYRVARASRCSTRGACAGRHGGGDPGDDGSGGAAVHRRAAPASTGERRADRRPGGAK